MSASSAMARHSSSLAGLVSITGLKFLPYVAHTDAMALSVLMVA
jgi:hypothetical protein